MNLPRARKDTLLRTDLADEVVVYDNDSKQAHSLNRLAVSVWSNCDGQNDVSELAHRVSSEIGAIVDELTIRRALRQLEAAHLLASHLEVSGAKTIGRRRMLQRAGQMGAVAVATPVVASILVPTAAAAASVVTGVKYHFHGTAQYTFGLPPGTLGPGPASPDTSSVTITNVGLSTFTGNIGFVAFASCAGVDRSNSFPITLNPGDSQSFSFSQEASNEGGFNATAGCGSIDNGAQFFMTGTVTQGTQSIAVDLRIFDKDIHSGVPRPNNQGIVLDNYILQGGSPTGIDQGDDFETTQAPGPIDFQN
jgi:Coenzyme PQQ synthesis protein D (PqqD)